MPEVDTVKIFLLFVHYFGFKSLAFVVVESSSALYTPLYSLLLDKTRLPFYSLPDISNFPCLLPPIFSNNLLHKKLSCLIKCPNIFSLLSSMVKPSVF